MMATPSTDVPLDELIDVIDTEETYFRAKGDERLLPLVKLPKAVVDAVMVHGMSPSGGWTAGCLIILIPIKSRYICFVLCINRTINLFQMRRDGTKEMVQKIQNWFFSNMDSMADSEITNKAA